MSALRHIDIRVTGKVQGVGYRYHARLKAHELGVCGFAYNQNDGSVYIEAEGVTAQLEAFVAWCWHGPSYAEVASVSFAEGKMKNFRAFETKREP